MPEAEDSHIVPQGGFVQHDLVLMTTPDGRMHCCRVVRVFVGDDHPHYEICHVNCDHNKEQWKLEYDAHNAGQGGD